jgi:hypothetical protein
VIEAHRFRRASGVLSRAFAAEVLLARGGREEIDRLSGPAAEVWEVLEMPRSIGEVVAIISEAFEVQDREIAGQLEALVKDMHDRGWLERTSGAGPSPETNPVRGRTWT